MWEGMTTWPFVLEKMEEETAALKEQLAEMAQQVQYLAPKDARAHAHRHTHTHTQTHRHTDTQTHRHTDSQTHRHTHARTRTHTQFSDAFPQVQQSRAAREHEASRLTGRVEELTQELETKIAEAEMLSDVLMARDATIATITRDNSTLKHELEELKVCDAACACLRVCVCVRACACVCGSINPHMLP